MENEKLLINEFKSELMSEFIRLCNGNDYNKLTLLKIGDTIDRLYGKYSILPIVDVVDIDKALQWLQGYTMTDTKQVYSNGCVYVPLFRVEQAFKDEAYNGLRES